MLLLFWVHLIKYIYINITVTWFIKAFSHNSVWKSLIFLFMQNQILLSIRGWLSVNKIAVYRMSHTLASPVG
jgi:hypothetical protein